MPHAAGSPSKREQVSRGEVVDRVVVAFSGDGDGEGELAFGQLGLWQSIEESGTSKTVAHVAVADPGTTVAAVADMLGFVVGRHQSLRTTLVLRKPGRSPRQRVSSSGEITLLVVDAGDDEPATVAEELREHWKRVPFDYETEWPVRMGAVVADGPGGHTVTHVVTVILHTSVDGFGLGALLADVRARDPVTGAPGGPVGLTPLEQAAAEASPEGRRQNEQSLRYVERVLRTAPAGLFGPPRHDVDRDHVMLRYRSPAIALAMRAVAVRERFVDSPALLAAFLVGVGRVTGVNPLVTMLLVSNRFRPGCAHSISALMKVAPLVLDLAGATVGDAAGAAIGKTLCAYRNAYYDAYEQEALIERIGRERGEELDLSCFYNDRRQRDRLHAGTVPPPAARIRAALSDSELSWRQEPGIPRMKLYLSVDDPPDAVELVLSADVRYFARDELAVLAAAIEEAAVQAAVAPDTPTELTAGQPRRAAPRRLVVDG